ncbi:hypothetical protein EX895_003586 [Sporisorium graminicola]|uniref:Uncharacterized protein n=1 Tax=Sporisorium graminicola TaxID=280036 RepID=A0A4U7KXK8_9BASI|nr:hypothetical protein EX895_003586 [Sporisorium graminicola]TKY87572.1 hypothetical protein EX895_003586 [Sporisorium graminicola]
MTISDSFWSFARLAESWTSTPPPASKPRRRAAVFTQQHIETIGGGSKSALRNAVVGDPRLPVELIVHIVLLAAHHVAQDEPGTSSKQLLELARVSRACHRAIYAALLLPDLRLYGFEQMRSFAVSLDMDRIGIRTIARTRLRSLTLRARSLASLEHGYGPALFDASQAQTHFEKELLPFVRIILSHCHALQTLHLEGVPRGLQRQFAQLSNRLERYSCLVGHYGGDLERDFWLAQRWSRLTHLQLHGPRFRFTPTTASTLAGLPQLQKLGLIVPMIVSSPVSSSVASADSGAIELDLTGSINPLQVLIDRCSTLEVLLLVGHAEKDYVGYTEKYRRWLRGLRRPRLSDAKSATMRLELVSTLRRDDELTDAMPQRRVHPCEVSAWMMQRARHGEQWFDGQEQQKGDSGLDYWIESFELAEHPSTISTGLSTTTTSALMSRTGSNTPSSTTTAALAASRMQERMQHPSRGSDEAIQAVDTLSGDEDVSSDEM